MHAALRLNKRVFILGSAELQALNYWKITTSVISACATYCIVVHADLRSSGEYYVKENVD